MKRHIIAAVAVCAIAVLAFVGRRALSWSTGPKLAAPEITTHVVRGDLRSVVKATGVVRPAVGAEVRVGAQVSGVLKHLYVATGDKVRRGSPLAQIEPRELRAKRELASASLDSAVANARFAHSDLDRKRALAKGEVIPAAELDSAERAASVAEAAVNEARATLDVANVQLEETRIVAPISGVVSVVTLQEGETVAAGLAAPTFLTLIDLDRLEVWAYVDETDIGHISVGQEARFGVDAYPDREFAGQVTSIRPKPEIRDNVVDYVVVIQFSPPKQETLRPEMTANVRITLEARTNVLALPREAVRREQGRSFVLYKDGERILHRTVVVGEHDESLVEIVEGLREGEAVLRASQRESASNEKRESND